MKLLIKISLIVIIGGIAGAAIISYFAFNLIMRPTVELVGNQQMVLAQNTLNGIDHLMQERYLDIRSIAEEENFQYFLASGDIDREDIYNRMKELVYLTGPWDALLVVDANGEILLSSLSVPPKFLSKQIEDYPYNFIAYKEAMNGQPYYSDIVRMKYSDKPSIIFAAPVYYTFGGEKKVVGAVVGNLSHRVITEVLKELPGEAHIYNKDGLVIATNQDHQEEVLIKNIYDNKHINYGLAAQTVSAISMSADRRIHSFVSQAVQNGFLDYGGNDWRLIYEVESEKVFSLASSIVRKFTLLLLPVILAMFGAILIVFIWFVIRPIRSLTAVTREIKSGNLSKRSNIKSKDEIGELSGSFNDMLAQVEEVDKAKTEFISLASHQLRTPVSTVNWYAETLLNNEMGEINENQKNYIEKIYKNNKRMGKLINALLDSSRMELGTLNLSYRLTDLDQTTQSVLDEYELKAKEKNISITSEVADEVKSLYTEPMFFKIIIENFISNAIKYNKVGGKINIEILKENSGCLVKVSDTGYGILANEQSKIFTKLFRGSNILDNDTDGIGLGLYIVKAMVERMGGKIWFESKENKGTTFFVSLPIKKVENINN